MSKPAVRMVTQDFDHLGPLACGDVEVEGVELHLERHLPNPLPRVVSDPTIDAGEISWSRHLMRLAQGDHSIVGIPIFPFRAFRHRCFFVLRGSNLRGLEDLEGARVGTQEWVATGNVWARAALRDSDVPLDSIEWWEGSIDGGPKPGADDELPANVREVPPGQSLAQLLIDGQLDALMIALPPQGFYEPDSPIVRLIPDYRLAEQAYLRRTGLYPAHHIVGIRRELFERHPWVANNLYLALERSKRIWQARRRLAETTPWLLAEIEEAMQLTGVLDWQPSGVEPNREMTSVFCDEMYAQKLLSRPLDPSEAFAAFERLVS